MSPASSALNRDNVLYRRTLNWYTSVSPVYKETVIFQCMNIVTKIAQCGGIHHEEFLLLKALILANVDIQMEDISRLMNFRDTVLEAFNKKVVELRQVT